MGQSEFSADVVRTADDGKDGSTIELKIYVGRTKARLEPQFPAGPHSPPPPQLPPFIVAERKGTIATAVMPQQQEYLEAPEQMMQHYRQFFQMLDTEDGCAALLRAPQNLGWTCHKVGSQTLNEREATEYEANKSTGEWFRFWIDQKLRVAVKQETDKNGYEVRNIREGVQSANLFEIPADYTRSKGMFGVIQSTKPK
jgi:hypothetical protein